MNLSLIIKTIFIVFFILNLLEIKTFIKKNIINKKDCIKANNLSNIKIILILLIKIIVIYIKFSKI